jgi:Family of unknown function (DUF5681)
MTYEKGQSGNPAGRPPGSRNKATILAETMFQGEAETIIRRAIDKAKGATSRRSAFASNGCSRGCGTAPQCSISRRSTARRRRSPR